MSKGGWAVPVEWKGETAFIIGGGPSVLAQNVSRLEGRNVVAVNSSFKIAPFAQYVFAGDSRWLSHNSAALKKFKGKVVTCGNAVKWPGLLSLSKKTPLGIGISDDPRSVVFRRTSLHGAINLAVLLGATRLVLLGADGRASADGCSHHHDPHPWPQKPDCWNKQRIDLATAVAPLKAKGVEVVNASPGSAWADLWPVVSLEDYL
jgi:hypothetical protein